MRKDWFVVTPLAGAGLVVLLTLFFAGCGGSGGGSGAGAATITGFAVDAGTRAPLAGATVSAQGHSVPADAGGFFTLTGLTPGAVTLTLAASGHQTTTMTVALSEGGLALGLVPVPPVHVPGAGDVSGTVTFNGTGVVAGRLLFGAARAVTDSFGNFTLYNLPAGVATITAATSDGTAVTAFTVTVPADGRLSGVTVVLTSGPPPPPGV